MIKINKQILLLSHKPDLRIEQVPCLARRFYFLSQFRVAMLLLLFVPNFMTAQALCEPIYSIERVSTMMANVMENSQASNGYQLQAVIGQGLITANTAETYTYRVASGFFADYLTEPKAPLVNSSDGDYQEMVLIDWHIEGDFSGPPVTSDEVTLFRNGYILTTLPMIQTQYLDFNVFPGEYYTYGVTVVNDMGESQTNDNVGFLNPNGMITGHVETPSGNPIHNAKVKLTPNLGRCVKFDGDGYLFWFDGDINTNRQFPGLENDYTIETWFRSVNLQEQTLFSAVDSASTNHKITIGLSPDGSVNWKHMGTLIKTVDPFAGPGADWHHLAVVKSGSEMVMYIDGFIVGQAGGVGNISDKVEIIMGKHGPREPQNPYIGRLDDFRIWSYGRDWDDLRNMMDITLSGEEEGLVVYYKFDEVEGDVVFDLTDGDRDGKTCRVDRDDYIAPVYQGALTNLNGDYIIKAIYYAGGTSFIVTPSMSTAIGRAIKFDGVNDYIDFIGQRIDLSQGYTLEGWFKTASDASMALFSSMDPVTGSAQLSVSLNEGKVSTTHFESGLSSSDTYHDNLWHHYAVTCDNSTLTLYVDAEEVGTQSVSAGIEGVSELVIARNESGANYFTGLLDEIRIWSTVRTAEQVSGTMNQSLEGDNFGLTHYWRINDGTGNLTTDEVGQITGTITGATEEEVESMWSKDIPLNEFFDHWFEPESRLATLNQSNTSIDQVDYTDESLIPVSGYVKFENTACFLQGVEILINGESLIPSLHSESDGKFTVEIEPGATGQIISCYYKTPGTGAGEFPEELHEFLPPLIELPMMVQPISGLYFSDKTTRTVDGKVAGGTCEHSINPSQGQIEVNIQSTDGCFEVSLVPNENNGAYEFSDFPPLTYNVSIDHPNPTIDDFFMAEVIDLEKEDFTKDFIYRASLEVEFGDLYRLNFQTKERSELVDTGECETGYTPVNYYTHYQLEYNVFETYGENTCKVDTFNITISDQVSGQNYSYVSTDTEEGLFGDWYMDIFPLTVNLLDGGAHPYQSGINILAENIYGSSEVYSKWLLVTGTVQIPESNFQTDSESHPWFILRVPPGDGSSTYYESGTEKCEYSSYEFVDDEGGSASATLNLGGDVTMNMGMPGATTEIEASNTYDIGAGFEYNNSFTNAGEEETCITVTETYTAFGDGLLTGDDATVFVGGGESFSFGLVKELVYDECEVSIDTTISIDNEGVASTYVHSKYYIVNVMIPNALMLYQLGDEASYDIWQNWLEAIAYDSTLIAESSSDAAFAVGQVVDGDEQEPTGDTYLSFDAGATVEYSYSTSVMTSSTHGYSEDFTETIFLEVGISLNGFGVSGSAGATLNQNSSTTNTDGNTSSTSVGFVLDDDDPGDGFLVQIKKDEKNMPVFFTAGGQSSCPWEQNTVRRELAVLSAEQTFVHDVPPDESAVFTLLLGNASETGESNYYELAAEMTTLNGAAITANGQSLGGGGQVFWLNAGEQAPVIVEVSRGPIGYEFDDIALELHSPCEGDIAADLGANTQNAAGILLSVHFQEPCSETNIANLENGWVIDGSQVEDTLWVTVNNYNFPPDSFVTSIDLQYRRGGSGDWFTAYSVSNEDVIDEYLLMPFNISPNIIIDGAYELRAQAQCTGGKYPGTSQAVSGLIDRTAPLVLGLPEPVDGILGPDDLIRVSLNEDVLCGSINPGAGDIQLWNTVTGQPVDFEFTCGFNQVTIEPAPANTWLENQTFRAEIHSLEDMYGNVRAEAIVWEFFINRNPIEWSGTNIDNIVIFIDEEYSTSRTLVNNGGSNRSYDIIGGREGAMPSGDPLAIPSWLTISPTEGTLTPGASQDISISLAQGLDFGEYSTTIYAAGTMGDEPMIIDIRKLCFEPEWSLNPFDFEFSMTIIATLSTEGELSSDLYDRIGVFVGEELRGIGELSFVEPLDDMGLHAYETFLTIYSNQQSGEELSFRVWDASECTELGWIEESYSFEANAALGNLTSPATITSTSQIITQLEFSQGWTWFSLNLTRSDMELNSIFSEANAENGDLIRSQTAFSQYVPGNGWFGSLTSMNNDEMYMIRISNADILNYVGYAVDVELDTISVLSGWNWIGYMPQSSMDVNYGLSSLPSATGDIIKSQFEFAQFLEGFGWFGSLTFMNPKLGYMLKSLYPGQLTYPFFDQPPAAKEMAAAGSTLAEDAPDWNVAPHDFEHSMSVTGSLYIHDEVSVNPLDMIAAFVDGDCRGVAQPVYYPALDKFLIFMTIYSSGAENEVIEFIAFNSDESSELYIPEQVDFQINAVYGNIEEPFGFNARYLAIGDPGYIPIVFSLAQNYPNPFNPVTTIGYGLPADASVELVIFNILGQEVARLVDEKKNAGFHFVSWNGTNDFGKPLAGGIYLYQIRAKNVSPASGHGFVKTHKLILLK